MLRRSPKAIPKPTHKFMGELFLLDGEKLFIWNFTLVKWVRLRRSFANNEIILHLKRMERIK